MAKTIVTSAIFLFLLMIAGTGLFLFGRQAFETPTWQNIAVFAIYCFLMMSGFYETYRKMVSEIYGNPEKGENNVRTNSSRNRG